MSSKERIGKAIIEILHSKDEPCSTRQVLQEVITKAHLSNITISCLGNHMRRWCINSNPRAEIAEWILKEEYK